MKKVLSMLLVLALALSVVGCTAAEVSSTGTESATATEPAATEAAAPAADSGKVYDLKLSLVQSANEPFGELVEILKSRIEEYTNGRVKCEVYYNGELGDNVDTCEAILQGANIVTFPTFDFYAPYILDVSILDGPFFFQSPDELAKLEASDWWAEQVQKMEDINLWYGGAMYLGARSLLHNVPGAKLPEDFKGQVMRSASTTMRHAMCEAITGNVATIAWSEIYSALSTGVAEMCEAPLGSIVSTKIYEVCRYITLDEHIYAFQAPWIAKSWVDALPADVREGFERAVKETCAESVDYINQSEAEYRALLESEGVTFIEVDDKDAWVEATKSAYDSIQWEEPDLYQKCQAILGR
ncbi:MAG: TRAP transporter substrate-binding protein [Clostridiales bacterium]|nr:TRAP transporter substrate-binding protein [Clostridiales bacterium]